MLLAVAGMGQLTPEWAAAQSPAQRQSAVASQPPLDTAALLASARPTVEAANAAWLDGLRRRDAAAIAEPYAEDAVFIAPDGEVVRGRVAIEAMYRARFPKLPVITGGGVTQGGMRVAGPELLIEWGWAWVETPAASGGTVRRGGSYMTAWARREGRWRIIRNIAL